MNDVKCAGQTTSFTITANGTSISYQWRKGTTNLSNGGNISGATSATLTLSNMLPVTPEIIIVLSIAELVAIRPTSSDGALDCQYGAGDYCSPGK
ncbi:MAG: hypothetical protein WDO15_24635 [Bacteroidota bacterium]